MELFNSSVTKSVNILLSKVEDCVSKFADILVKEEKEEWKPEDLIVLWNSISPDFSIMKKGASCSDEQCEHVYQKEPRNGERCDGKIYEKSETQKYCVKHYKADEKPKKSKVSVPNDCLCIYIKKSGEEVGEPCNKKVTANSKTKQYCAKHISEEKIKIPTTEIMAKFFKEKKLDEVDEENLDETIKKILKECLKKYTIIGVYTLKKTSPKFYKKYSSYVNSFLSEELLNKYKEILTQFEEEQKIDQEKKDKKKSKTKEQDKSEKSKQKKYETEKIIKNKSYTQIPKEYIMLVFNNLFSDATNDMISKDSITMIQSLLHPLLNNCDLGPKYNEKKTKQVEKYLNENITGDLLEHAQKELNKSIESDKYIRHVVVEYIMAEILELSIHTSDLYGEENKVIKPEHIKEAILNDEELSFLYKKEVEKLCKVEVQIKKNEIQDYSKYYGVIFEGITLPKLSKNMASGIMKWMEKFPNETRNTSDILKMWIENDKNGDEEFYWLIKDVDKFCAKVEKCIEKETSIDDKKNVS